MLGLLVGLAAAGCAGLYLAWARSERERRRLTVELTAQIERTRETIAELTTDKSQLGAIVNSIVEAVVAVDAEGRVYDVNPALCALFGVQRDTVWDRPFVEVLRHARLSELLGAVAKEGRGRVDEIVLFTPDETIFEAHAVPLLKEGQRLGALLILHDITRLRRLERLRREFVANVSHELRTPLASIRGYAETLKDGAIDDKANRMEFLEAIETDAIRLTALVDELLDLSAIESGHRPPKLETLSVLDAAREAAARLAPIAAKRKVIIDVSGDAAPAARADRAQLAQVFTNLLDNALKFNRENGRVEVSARRDGERLRVSVKDTGHGIPPADLPRVFERFYRVEKARTRESGGTGLGLAIVKHIVEAHGGMVSVESVLDEGSTFLFTLPLA